MAGERWWCALAAVVALTGGCGDEGERHRSPSDIGAALRADGIVATEAGTLRLCPTGAAQLLRVRGSRAIDAWKIARRLVARTGRWPVLLGTKADVERVHEAVRSSCRDGVDSRVQVQRGARLDPVRVLAGRRRRVGIRPRELRAEPPLARQPTSEADFTVDKDILTGKPHPVVTLALLPTTESWQAPALLLFGAWNDNPDAATHAALHRRWQERFGSEIVAVTGDVIETRVARPPTDASRAISLAREQFIYAPDIVLQGTEDLASLAATVLGGRSWYFWWD